MNNILKTFKSTFKKVISDKVNPKDIEVDDIVVLSKMDNNK